MSKIESALGPLAGALLGLGATMLSNRLGLNGADRVFMLLFVIGIVLVPVSIYFKLLRRVAALEVAAQRTAHAGQAGASSAPAR